MNYKHYLTHGESLEIIPPEAITPGDGPLSNPELGEDSLALLSTRRTVCYAEAQVSRIDRLNYLLRQEPNRDGAAVQHYKAELRRLRKSSMEARESVRGKIHPLSYMLGQCQHSALTAETHLLLGKKKKALRAVNLSLGLLEKSYFFLCVCDRFPRILAECQAWPELMRLSALLDNYPGLSLHYAVQQECQRLLAQSAINSQTS